MDPTTPDDTPTGSLRLRRRHDLAATSVGDELVVVDPVTRQPHLLNPTSSVVFEALDGSCTVDELVDDLADAFEAPHDVIEGDVLSLVEHLRYSGLLVDGTAAAVPPDPAPPAGFQGDPLVGTRVTGKDADHLLLAPDR